MKSAREKGSLHASSFASFHAIGCILKDQAGGGLSRGVKLLGSMQEDVGCWLAMLDHVACTNTTADYAPIFSFYYFCFHSGLPKQGAVGIKQCVDLAAVSSSRFLPRMHISWRL